MKPTIFETRERANELLKESFEIWRNSDFADDLEGLEKDPVFSLLIGALAYQENEFENDIARLRQEITDDFARLMTPFEIGHAVPASAVISTQPSDTLAEALINGDSEFKLQGEYSFIPLFNSKVLNVSVEDIERLDGRRWKVKLNFKHPVTDLTGFCFGIRDADFRSLNLKIKGANCHLIRSWNYSELPYSRFFSPESMIYNHGEYYSGSMLPFDLFVRQNIRLFWIDKFELTTFNGEELTDIELTLEFTGIKKEFVFDADNIVLNSIVLVNASVKEAVLTSSTPIARVAGYVNSHNKESSQQFLQLIKPSETQIYANAEIEVRRVTGDRFNQASLVKLLNSIVNKYHTDFYAFRDLEEMKSDKLLYNLQELISRMVKISQKDYLRNIAGVYLLLHERNRRNTSAFSLTVKYLTTSGAAVNSNLDRNAIFQTPGNLNSSVTLQIANPCQGYDEVSSDTITKSLLRYYMVTNDRIVTPADIKLFCIKELNQKYSIGEEIIKDIKVAQRPTQDNYGAGYEICVDIRLIGSPMVKRSLGQKIPLLEIVLQKMMEVRSTGIYPIVVNITIED